MYGIAYSICVQRSKDHIQENRKINNEQDMVLIYYFKVLFLVSFILIMLVLELVAHNSK